MTKSLPLLIAGGGIGGLAAALSAARSGHTVVVLERAPQLGEIGAGIQLGPNAFHVFDRLGIGEQTRKMAVFINTVWNFWKTNNLPLILQICIATIRKRILQNLRSSGRICIWCFR